MLSHFSGLTDRIGRRAVVAVAAGLCMSARLVSASVPPAPRQATPPADTSASPAPADTAALVISGRSIAIFRSSLGAMSARERAEAARRRFDAATATEVPDSITVAPTAVGMLVRAGAHDIFLITGADLDSTRGETLRQAATGVAARMRESLDVVREARSVPLLLRAAGIALLATLALFVVLRLLVLARRAATRRLPDYAMSGVRDIGVGGFTLVNADQLLDTLRRTIGLLSWAIGMVAAYVWLTFVLRSFAYSRPWGLALGQYLRDTLTTLALGAAHAMPGLFTVVIIVGVTRWIARIVTGFFEAVEAHTVSVPWVHPDTANPTRRIAIALLWLFAIVVSYPYLPGSGSDVFKGVTVFAGLVLSLGSSGVMNQAMSGLVLMYSRALHPGDYVLVGDTEGEVVELGMLSTKVRTTKGELVTLPNAVVASAKVKNFSRTGDDGQAVLLHTSVTIGYDTPWRQVHGLLLLAADRTEGVLRSPAAFVLQTALSDFYIEYQLNVPLADPRRRIPVLSALHANIVDAFNEYGVQITSPHYETDPAAPKVVSRTAWRPAPAERLDADVPPPIIPGQPPMSR